MIITPNMSLFAWTSDDDDFDHTQLATNFQRADSHDHTPGKGVRLDGTAAIIAGSITAASIAAGTITATLIASGTITHTQIANNTIQGSNIDPATTITINGLNVMNLSVTGSQTLSGDITAQGTGIFIGGVQSGDGSNLNQVISYGGYTAVHGGITIQNSGGIGINNGNIIVTLGSITLNNGNMTANTGQGTFIGGVQSGDATHHNQVITYGGLTVENNGITINDVGGISINNGDIDSNFGSLNMTNGNIVITTGSISTLNGNITTYGGAVGATGIGNFVGGVVSGSASAHNQVISYGGITSSNGNITSNGFDIHIATIGSLQMDNGKVFFNDGGSWYLEHNFDGTHNNILTNAFAYVTTSDARLKENVRDIEDPTDLLKALRGHRFDWKETGQASIGFIAQEVKEIFPEIVGDEVEVNLSSGESGSWHVMDRSLLIAPLWEASRAMLTRIEALEKKATTK